MINYSTLKELTAYLYFFPIFLLLLIIIFIFGKKKIDSNRISFYGVFMGINNRNILSLSILFLYYYLIIMSIFVNSSSIIIYISLLVSILLFNIINIYIINIFLDTVHTSFIYILLYSKNIFYQYMEEVGNYWYVQMLFIFLSLFILLYATYFSIKRLKHVIAKNKYIINKKTTDE